MVEGQERMHLKIRSVPLLPTCLGRLHFGHTYIHAWLFSCFLMGMICFVLSLLFLLLLFLLLLVIHHKTGLPPRNEGPQGNGGRCLAMLSFPMAITIGRFASMCVAAGA